LVKYSLLNNNTRP